MSITPKSPAISQQGWVQTWVTSQWKNRPIPGRFSAEINIEQTIENPARTRLPTHTVEAALKSLSAEITDAQNTERSARAEFDRLRGIYREHVADVLRGDIESLGTALSRRFDEILELLEVATELSGQARKAGVTLPAVVMDAPVALRLAETMVGTLSRTISKGYR